MKKYIFKCKLLSDIVLFANTATEGVQDTLDFIPGSNFLGIVAKNYNNFTDSYAVFHSGKVRFGDAHISKNGERSLKSPLGWFVPKDEELSKPYIFHSLDQEMKKKLIKEGKQLKQVRSGWFQKDGLILDIESDFAIKSAHDRDNRRSKDGMMYGYNSIKSGTEWMFVLNIESSIDQKDEELILSSLTGIKHLGKSRSAQYGLVEIEKINIEPSSLSTAELQQDKFLIVYAESRLAFFNDLGQPEMRPGAKHFNLPTGYILRWDKSQVKSQVFSPFNGKNNHHEADRICFNKGSVFVFEKVGSEDLEIEKIATGIGDYLNEGFGNVIVNPAFLKSDLSGFSDLILKKYNSREKNSINGAVAKHEESDNVIQEWISHQKHIAKMENDIYENVVKFVKSNKRRFSNITSSQWGQIRSIASVSDGIDSLIDKLFRVAQGNRSQDRSGSGFLEHGKSAEKWRECKDLLKAELENNKYLGTDYAVILCAQMQKEAAKEKGGKQ